MPKRKSILCVASAATLYGLEPALISGVYANGGNSYMTTMFLALGGVLILGVILIIQKADFRISRALFQKLIIEAAIGACATCLLLYYSYTRIPSGIAATLHYIYPMFIAVFLVAVYHEKLTKRAALAVLLTVTGIALISGFRTADRTNLDLIGIIAALCSGACWGFYIVYMDKSGISEHDPRLMNFYIYVITVPVSGLAALLTGNFSLHHEPAGWLYLLVAIILSRVIAGPLLLKGIAGAGAMVSGVLETLEPITAMVMGILFLNDRFTADSLVGAALVLGAAVLIATQKGKDAKKSEGGSAQ